MTKKVFKLKNLKTEFSVGLTIFIILIFMKILGFINLNWFLVLTSFIWIPFIIISSFVVFIFLLGCCLVTFDRIRVNREYKAWKKRKLKLD